MKGRPSRHPPIFVLFCAILWPILIPNLRMSPVRHAMLRVEPHFCEMLRVKNSRKPCLYWVVAGLLPRDFCVAGPDPKKTQCLQACCGCCGSRRGEMWGSEASFSSSVFGYRFPPFLILMLLSNSKLRRTKPKLECIQARFIPPNTVQYRQIPP